MIASERPEGQEAPALGGAWALPGLAELRAETAGDPRITVAVLDGPVDLAHPCFTGADLTPLTAFVAAEGAGSDHGTHVASVLFGQPGGPLRGLAPRCRGLLVPVYSQPPGGPLVPCRQIDLARAIDRAAVYGAQVINISGGELTEKGEADPFLVAAVRRAAESNVLLVSAVGNDSCECLHVPAALPSVLAIGAHDGRGRPMGFSNWGEGVARQGLLAPGEAIGGALPGGGTGLWSGTSFAAAVASGVAALLLSLQVAMGRQPDPRAVRAALLASAAPCDPGPGTDCRRLLSGRLDVRAARARLGLAARAPQSSTHRGRPSSTTFEGDRI